MNNNLKFLSKEEARAILNPETVNAITLSRRGSTAKDTLETITIGSIPASVNEFLGSGGSKEVYDISIEGTRYALALPGIQDLPSRIIDKWNKVLHEPVNTKQLREAGLVVNDLCEVVPTIVNGHPFPALIMKRYEDHSFPIYDSKNHNRNNNPAFSGQEEPSEETAFSLFRDICTDIGTLAKRKILVGIDSINLCIPSKFPRLYFNDLGTAIISDSNVPVSKLHSNYILYAINAFLNSFSYQTYKSSSFLQDLVENKSFTERLMEEIKTRNK